MRPAQTVRLATDIAGTLLLQNRGQKNTDHSREQIIRDVERDFKQADASKGHLDYFLFFVSHTCPIY